MNIMIHASSVGGGELRLCPLRELVTLMQSECKPDALRQYGRGGSICLGAYYATVGAFSGSRYSCSASASSTSTSSSTVCTSLARYYSTNLVLVAASANLVLA